MTTSLNLVADPNPLDPELADNAAHVAALVKKLQARGVEDPRIASGIAKHIVPLVRDPAEITGYFAAKIVGMAAVFHTVALHEDATPEDRKMLFVAWFARTGNDSLPRNPHWIDDETAEILYHPPAWLMRIVAATAFRAFAHETAAIIPPHLRSRRGIVPRMDFDSALDGVAVPVVASRSIGAL